MGARKLDSKGMGLVNVLVASAMVGGLALTVSALFTQSMRAQRSMETKSGQVQLHNEMYQELTKPESCKLSLAPVKLADISGAGSSKTISVIKAKTETSVTDAYQVSTGEKVYLGTVWIKSMTVLDYVSEGLGVDTRPIGNARLRVEFKRMGEGYGELKPKEIKLQMKFKKGGLDPMPEDGEVFECFAVGGISGAELWSVQSGTQNIFYNAGNVGIGTAAPGVALEVNGGIKPGTGGVSLGGACAIEGVFAYDGAAHVPVYCNSAGKWSSMAGGPFGGMYHIDSCGSCEGPNPYTSTCSCPPGFATTQLVNNTAFDCSPKRVGSIYLCWKSGP